MLVLSSRRVVLGVAFRKCRKKPQVRAVVPIGELP